ncbi:hypothetical protein L2E82_05942 [Cichorium intybus]|uniref:Uncharacterized protein n=1 Tax=Cichorium intybus TaxID=13427 RepID=A0ACB9HAV2_CICIN|nr:hypothetical protein L2E82_05942 [Cichorium intybus]
MNSFLRYGSVSSRLIDDDALHNSYFLVKLPILCRYVGAGTLKPSFAFRNRFLVYCYLPFHDSNYRILLLFRSNMNKLHDRYMITISF